MILRFGHFSGLLEDKILKDKIVNLGPIDFQLGLLLDINGNYGQNTFEVHISKYVTKIQLYSQK